MRKLLGLYVVALLALSVIPAISAASVGSGVGVDITTEKFAPLVWMCDNRVVYDDNTEPGRISQGCGSSPCTDKNVLVERINNYAFEGEKVHWTVLVMDKNGIDKVNDVFATIGEVQGAGNDIQANCKRFTGEEDRFRDEHGINPSCNARIQEEVLTDFNPELMSYYDCTLTVETPDSMHGKYFATVEATDLDGLSGTMAENEYWFFNPVIALSIDGDLKFNDVRPGAQSYSDTILVGNDAESGSGVMMDMFISGTDFYDSASSGAKCPDTNQLSLSNFRYFATNGAYNSKQDLGHDVVANGIKRHTDSEGYTNIDYGIGFNNPNKFYDNMEILQAQQVGPYYTANILAPGSQMALTFKLSLPEPCNGDFNSGQIYFWGEAV